MNKVVSIDDIVPLIKEQLDKDGCVKFTPKGNSMLPTLRNNKDCVTLGRPELPLKKYQIAFYVRDNNQYVLHRVVKVEKSNTYVMRGDNQFRNEKGVRENQIIGVVKSFTRNGKEYYGNERTYKFYCILWYKTVKLRKILRRIRIFAGKIKRKIIGIFR